MPTLEQTFATKERFIDDRLKLWRSSVLQLQNDLWDLIGTEYIPSFNIVEGGNLATNNVSKAIQLDAIFDQFNNTFQRTVFRKFAGELLQLNDFSKEYFKQSGFATKTVNKISQSTGFIEKSIGINSKGQLIRGSYLDRLGQAQGVRDELKNFVINQVSTKVNLKDFQRGFKDLVTGNRALGVQGDLLKYHQQFSFDTFSQVSQITDNFYADQLGLTFFVYQGSLIKTSRCFCIKRAGKIFNISDTKNWRRDSQLLGDPNTYNPKVERGRWNCRHQFMFISDENAEERGYTKKKANSILRKGCKKK